jgi:septal ring factor EnvC (AmiA/AmiB activator)
MTTAYSYSPSHYQQQRWQLHAQLQSVKTALETLEQQLSEIDAGLLELNPELNPAAHSSDRGASVRISSVEIQDTPLPIAAG